MSKVIFPCFVSPRLTLTHPTGRNITPAGFPLAPYQPCLLGLPTHRPREGSYCQGFGKIKIQKYKTTKIQKHYRVRMLPMFWPALFFSLGFSLFVSFPHFHLCKAACEANLDLSFDWRGRDVAEEELLEELPDLEDMEDLLAQLIHWWQLIKNQPTTLVGRWANDKTDMLELLSKLIFIAIYFKNINDLIKIYISD